jgi:hypothetical protein
MPLTFLRNLGIVSSAGISTTKLGTGAVLQAVTATDSTLRSTSSSSFATASNTLSVSITPSSASNKVFIIGTTSIQINGAGFMTIFRGATDLGAASNKGMVKANTGTNPTPIGISFLDSPNTTSATTYQIYIRCESDTVYINLDSIKASITAFEIKG